MSNVPCSNWIRSEDTFDIGIADILPRIRSHRVDVLPWILFHGFWLAGNELEAWAQDELRSVNGQVEYLLRQAVQKRKGGKGQTNPPSTRPRIAKT